MVEPPEDEIPGGSVPQSTKEHRDHQVQGRAVRSSSIASEWDVQVVAEPGGETDVPSSPELARVAGEVGEGEVSHEPYAHQARRSACDVRIAGEVAVDLDGKEAGRDDDVREGYAPGRRKYRIHCGRKTICDGHLLEETQQEQLDAIHSPMVTLPAGGTIVFDPTEALVAIDVNSGRSTRERNIEETALRTNLEAAEEIARQLRLRDLAGLVVIDFIDMEVNRNKQAVERKLKEAMRIDRARIQIGRISPFGLLELSRQRLRPSLHESITQVCPHCGGTGHVRSTESSALHALREIEREGVRRRSKEARIFVPDRVALYLLNQKRNDLAQIEARYGLRVVVETDDTLIAPNLRLERIKADHPLPAPVRAPEAAIDDDDAEAEDDPSDDSALDDIVADEAADAPAAAQTAGQRPRSGDDDGGQRRRRRGRRGGRRRRRDDPERRDDPIAAATPSSAEAPADGDEAPEDEDWGVDERFRPYRFDTAAAGDAPEADTMETGGGQPSAGGEAATRKRRRRGRRGGRGRRRDKLPNEAAANPPAGGEPGFGQPGDGDNDTGGDTDSDIPHSARDLGGEETAGAGERMAAESYNGRHGEAVDTSPQSSQGDVPSLFSRRDDDVETAEVADRPDRSAHGIDGDTEPQNNARPRRSGWWNRST